MYSLEPGGMRFSANGTGGGGLTQRKPPSKCSILFPKRPACVMFRIVDRIGPGMLFHTGSFAAALVASVLRSSFTWQDVWSSDQAHLLCTLHTRHAGEERARRVHAVAEAKHGVAVGVKHGRVGHWACLLGHALANLVAEAAAAGSFLAPPVTRRRARFACRVILRVRGTSGRL